jgi:hypothetical protein
MLLLAKDRKAMKKFDVISSNKKTKNKKNKKKKKTSNLGRKSVRMIVHTRPLIIFFDLIEISLLTGVVFRR